MAAPRSACRSRLVLKGLTQSNIYANLFHDALATLRGRVNRNEGTIVPTRKSPFSLIPVLICFVAVLWLAVACADAAPEYRNFDKEPCPTRSPAMGGSVPTSTESPDDSGERIHNVRLRHDDLF